jgi:hypothetical protein
MGSPRGSSYAGIVSMDRGGLDRAQSGRCDAPSLRNGQREAEHGTCLLRTVLELKCAAMLLDHRPAQAQSQAHAFGAGGEERREQALRTFRFDARAAVDHFEDHPVCMVLPHADAQHALGHVGKPP